MDWEKSFSNFDDIIDAVEIDPRARAKRAVRNIAAVNLRNVPENVASDILRSQLEPIATRIVVAIERGNFSAIDDLVNAFDLDVSNAVRRERTTGRLRPWSAQAEFDKFAGELDAKGWRGRILNHWRTMLKPDERIQAVDFFEIRTSQRCVSRAEIKDFGRTTTETNDSFFARQFLSDDAVRQLESDAADQAARAARAPWADNGNRDIPRVRA